MKANFKKVLSVVLALTFILSMVPAGGIFASAEAPVEKTLEDGTVWLTNVGSNGEFTVKNGEYAVNKTGAEEPGYSVISKKKYPAMTTEFRLSSGFRREAYFGFSTDYALKNTSQNGYVFFKIDHSDVNPPNTTSYYISVNGTWYKLGQLGGRTRNRYMNIGFSEMNGSIYLSIDGLTIDGIGGGHPEEAKLEKYIPKEYFKNNGGLHFTYGSAEIFGSGRFMPVEKLADRAVVSAPAYGDSNNPDAFGYRTVPSVEYVDNKTNTTYTFKAGKGGNQIRTAIPVGIIENGASNIMYTSIKYDGDKGWYGQDWHCIMFSNDPAFPDAKTEKIDVVRVGESPAPHILAKGETHANNPNFFYDGNNTGAWYGWQFFVKDGKVMLKAKTGNFGPDFANAFDKIEVGKPIYMGFNVPDVDKYTNGLNLEYKIEIQPNSATKAADKMAADIEALPNEINAQNYDSVMSVVDAYYANGYMINAASAVKVNEILVKSFSVLYKGRELDEKIAKLPAIDKLVFSDKAAVEALVAEYNALSQSEKDTVTRYDLLMQYKDAVANLAEDGKIRTDDGNVYTAVYDPANIKLESHPKNGGLMVKLLGEQNKEGSAIGFVTDTAYPVRSAKYEFTHYFGVYGSSRFGLSVSDDIDVLDRDQNGRIAFYRTESGNNTAIYVEINGEPVECYNGVKTRIHLFELGVAKVGESYYATLDGEVLDGMAYSAEVQEALKLENHFDISFLERDGLVHFFAQSESLFADSYFKPEYVNKNGIMGNIASQIGDRNAGFPNIAKFNSTDVTKTVSGDKEILNFTVTSGGYTAIATPVDMVNGFTMQSRLKPAGDAWLDLQFSNDPTFSDGTEMTVTLVHFSNGQGTIFGFGTELAGRFSAGAERTVKFVETEDGRVTFAYLIPGADRIAAQHDFTPLMDAPIYLRFKGNEVAVNNITLKKSVNKVVNTPAEDTSDPEWAEMLLTDFYADPARYTRTDLLEKATNQMLEIAAKQITPDIEMQLEEVPAEPTSWFAGYDAIMAIGEQYKYMTAFERSLIAGGENIGAMYDYAKALAVLNADTLIDCRRALIGANDSAVSAYDYYHDDTLNIVDLVRAKKELVSKK